LAKIACVSEDIPIPADICWPELKRMGVMTFLVLAINAFLIVTVINPLWRAASNH
jgi:hypothetical protein